MVLLTRERIRDELIELLCEKLLNLPTPHDVEPDYDYESVRYCRISLITSLISRKLQWTSKMPLASPSKTITYLVVAILKPLVKWLISSVKSLKERWPEEVEG